MVESFKQAVWLLLAPGAANMAPVFAARWFPNWNAPMDFGLSWRGERLFGHHKTLRGLVAGAIASGVVFFAQVQFSREGSVGGEFDFPNESSPLWCGFWLGFCVLVADAFKSFFKRRRGIAPGESWLPFDKIDWVLGAWLGALPFHHLGAEGVLTLLLVGFLLSLASHGIGYLLRLNKEPL